jgi:hypothetical protein
MTTRAGSLRRGQRHGRAFGRGAWCGVPVQQATLPPYQGRLLPLDPGN